MMNENMFWVLALLMVIAIGVVRGWFRIQKMNQAPHTSYSQLQQRKFEEKYYRTHPREEPGYDYRMIIASPPDAEGHRQEVEILTCEARYGDWPRGGQIIKDMSREEFDGYLKSLTVNGWEITSHESIGPPSITYYRRTVGHPLKRA